LTLTCVSILLLCAGALPAGAGEGGLTLFTAERDPASGLVHLRAFRSAAAGDREVAPASEAPEEVPPGLSLAEWHRFGLRGGAPHSPAERPSVREAGEEDELPRLQWDALSQVLAYTSAAGPAGGGRTSGLAVLEPAGARILAEGGEGSYRPAEGGSVVSWDGARVVIAVRGDDREGVVVIERAHGTLVARQVDLPTEVDRLVPESLTIALASHEVGVPAAVFFAGEDDEGQLSVWRVAIAASDPAVTPLAAERIAGPFEALGEAFAYGRESVAFLAGERDDAWDVYVVSAGGPAVNLTQSPARYIEHTLREARLAVAHDGAVVAYNLEVDSEPEVFAHRVASPGPVGRVHITRDGTFNPYIDQQVYVLFDASGRLYFDAGHSPSASDLFRIGGPEGLGGIDPAAPLDALNLSHTGTGIEPPFHTRGALSFRALAVAPADVLVYVASGFGAAGTGVAVRGASVATGDTVFDGGEVADAGGFFAVADDLYFSATAVAGEREVLRVRQGRLERVVRLDAGARVAGGERLLWRSEAEALFLAPSTGILGLRGGEEPRVVAAGDLLAGAALASAESGTLALVAGRPSADGGSGDYSVYELETGAEGPLVASAVPGVLVAASGTLPPPAEFIRGDANLDARLDISDPVAALVHLFAGGVALGCLDAADSNDDGAVDLSDALRTLGHLFLGEGGLPPPFPERGLDPTPDGLGCRDGPGGL
jgi:hypothetical protein